MKKFYGESWLAKMILFNNYLAITLGPLAFSKKQFAQKTKNHECTHMRQWAEVTIVSYIIVSILMLFMHIPSCVLFIPLISYYILYVLEWIFRLFIDGKHAYRRLTFEREAYDNELNDNYNTNCGYFGWIGYWFKSYDDRKF